MDPGGFLLKLRALKMTKTFFLTGATGVLGFEILLNLLRKQEARVFLLIRAQDPQHLETRMQKLRQALARDLPPGFDLSGLQALRGDLSQEKLGLAPQDWKQLQSVQQIVHSAADVSLDLSDSHARRGILDPCEELIDLQRTLIEKGGPCRLDFVSTVGVIGKSRFPLHEDWVHEVRRFNNTYEKYKALAENRLAEIEASIPVFIHRPSMIVGRSGSGQISRFQIFYFLLASLMGTKLGGYLPDILNYPVDTIPVDIAAQGIVASMNSTSSPRILNHCTGPEQSLRLWEIRRILESELGNLRPLKLISISKLRRTFHALEMLSSLFSSEWSRRMQIYSSILDYADSNPQFLNPQTRAFYRQQGISFPEPKDYLKNVIRFYQQSRRRKHGERE